ncbi:glycosyltransferase [Cryobacterium sp. TMT1-21]|uniref:glycosyltransferase family 2 protein n=1 Tax=Cryobacterium sp. TMT1-21 TaxID=1259234 RepID=UPI001068DBFE|nr:glycosyltransferase family A protein [Cryobacterium sp. TMT1-21]TFD16877.1 glycosyltransferase [Cryobacterium sp. TMT1-21]
MPSTVSEAVATVRTSSISGLVDHLLSEPAIDPRLASALHAVQEAIAEPVADGPFLSVLLRTQGRRLEPIKDALLCLAGQTSQDFEVIVIDHDSDPVGAAAVRKIIASQPASFGGRIRIVEVKGGNRARPLNAGIHAATGRYIAVFDDDDLLFGNWVAEFERVAETSSGRLLRGVVAVQNVAPEKWPQAQEGFRTISWPKAAYPREFDQLAHFEVNYSPFMSWAFPRSLFVTYGLEFDEELTVCEDWDMILRGSTMCGVDDVNALTAIYRRWEGGASSYTDHSKDSWAWSEARVWEKLDGSTLVLPSGSVTDVRWLLAGRGARNELNALVHSPAWRLARPLRGFVRAVRYGRALAGKARRRVRW